MVRGGWCLVVDRGKFGVLDEWGGEPARASAEKVKVLDLPRHASLTRFPMDLDL